MRRQVPGDLPVEAGDRGPARVQVADGGGRADRPPRRPGRWRRRPGPSRRWAGRVGAGRPGRPAPGPGRPAAGRRPGGGPGRAPGPAGPGSTRPPSSGSPVAPGQRSSSNSTGVTGSSRGRGGTSSLMSGHSHHGPPGRGRAAGERPERSAGVAAAGGEPASRGSSQTPRPSRPTRSSRSGRRRARASAGAFGSPAPSGRQPAPSSSDHHTPASVATTTVPGRSGSATTAPTGTSGSPPPRSSQVAPPSPDRHTRPSPGRPASVRALGLRRAGPGAGWWSDQAAQATSGRAGSTATPATRPGRGRAVPVTVQVPPVRSSRSSSPSAVPASRRSGPDRGEGGHRLPRPRAGERRSRSTRRRRRRPGRRGRG